MTVSGLSSAIPLARGGRIRGGQQGDLCFNPVIFVKSYLALTKKRKEPIVKNKQAKKLAKDRTEIELKSSSIASKVKIALPTRNNKLPIKIKLSEAKFFIITITEFIFI
ncbi:MAG: hypothetical protein AB4041_18130 [Microcystaceae cyanobacterium]